MKLIIAILCLFQIFSLSRTSTSHSNQQRIVNGIVSNNGQFPFAAAIYYHAPNVLNFCGGALLTSKWVLTAAHCIYGASRFDIFLGATDLRIEDPEVVRAQATNYIAHPGYVYGSLNHDVGLIELLSPVQFTGRIRPVDHLPLSRYPPYVSTVALGWGKTDDNDTTNPDILYHVELTTMANPECMRIYGNAITETMLCVIGLSNEGICRGDSGGPLVEFTEDGTVIHVGIATFFSGMGCDVEHPSGFTRTFEYVDWIRNITQFPEQVEDGGDGDGDGDVGGSGDGSGGGSSGDGDGDGDGGGSGDGNGGGNGGGNDTGTSSMLTPSLLLVYCSVLFFQLNILREYLKK